MVRCGLKKTTPDQPHGGGSSTCLSTGGRHTTVNGNYRRLRSYDSHLSVGPGTHKLAGSAGIEPASRVVITGTREDRDRYVLAWEFQLNLGFQNRLPEGRCVYQFHHSAINGGGGRLRTSSWFLPSWFRLRLTIKAEIGSLWEFVRPPPPERCGRAPSSPPASRWLRCCSHALERT